MGSIESFGVPLVPSWTTSNAVVQGKVESEGKTIEKVYFESRPGFLVRRNLYRPASVKGKAPGGVVRSRAFGGRAAVGSGERGAGRAS